MFSRGVRGKRKANSGIQNQLALLSSFELSLKLVFIRALPAESGIQ